MSPLIEKIIASLRDMAAGPVIVACSGGMDSVALFHAAHGAKMKRTLIVATVDHHLHGSSGDHAAFVEAMARAAHVEFVALHADRQVIMEGPGVEAGARAERYRLLTNLARARGAVCILTAHSADDQLETLLMRLEQGAGLRGMRGVLPYRDQILRPWLSVAKDEIETWARMEQLQWCEDPTNEDHRFLRNRVRHTGGVALAKAFGDRWTVRAARTAERLQCAYQGLTVLLEPILQNTMTIHPSAVHLDIAALNEQEPTVRRLVVDEVLHRAVLRLGHGRLNDQGLQNQRLWALAMRPGQGAQIDMGAGLRVFRDRHRLVIESATKADPAEILGVVSVAGPGIYRFGGWQLQVSVARPYAGEKTSGIVSLNRHPFPWAMRTAEAQERYRPLGAPGSQTLRRLWSNNFVPQRLRGVAPVLTSSSGLFGAAGLRMSESARASLEDLVVVVEFLHEE